MIILISEPEIIVNEAEVYTEVFKELPELRVHWRKPDSKLEDSIAFFNSIPSTCVKNFVVHQHYELMDRFELAGIHVKSNDHKNTYQNVISTSWHFGDKINPDPYTYFFCSPVFDSISKPGYKGTKWNISSSENEIREKAVALGGIDTGNISRAKELGFRNFAVLGAVWKAEDPIAKIKELTEICRK